MRNDVLVSLVLVCGFRATMGAGGEIIVAGVEPDANVVMKQMSGVARNAANGALCADYVVCRHGSYGNDASCNSPVQLGRKSLSECGANIYATDSLLLF